ncbi:helix-turn-helix domain-containing protein [Candidatus Poribacteria bacterium]|nr:helix-turn-helix domain-containing protein [Candidatus Poribacteria bacterium]
MLVDFLFVSFSVFVLSAFVVMLAARSAAPDTSAQSGESREADQRLPFGELDELVEAISHDKDLLTPPSPVQIPSLALPGARLGGGAVRESYSKTTGEVVLKSTIDPGEKRRYNRRMNDRRATESRQKDERRIVQRRVWLRREEDRRGKRLLNVSDAADTIGVPVERIYKWLDETDIPFYQVTEGKKKAIRFEINELLQWYSAFTVSARTSQPENRKGG